MTPDSGDNSEAPQVTVTGDVDVQSAQSLKSSLMTLVDAGHRRIVVDLTDCGFMDSTGLGALIAVAKSLEPHGRLELVRPGAQVTRLLTVTGMTHLLAADDR